jgi:putative ABC transport system permease protein
LFLAALRDLQWRKRRFIIAMVGTALVFAMSLILSGLTVAFDREADRFLDGTGATTFLAKEGTAGPFNGSAPIPATEADKVAALDGVERADPIIYLHQTVGEDPVDVNVFGVVPGGLGLPEVRKGKVITASGEAVVNKELGYDVGETLSMSGKDFKVVGLVHDATLNAGTDNVYIGIADAQALVLGGLPLATAIYASGTVPTAPDGLTAFTKAEAKDDLLRPLRKAISSIDIVRMLLWAVAACIVGSIVYLSALERTRDFAVYKAVGVSTRSLALDLAAQSVMLALVSALVAALIGWLLAPFFPVPVELPASALLALPVVAIVVGLLSSLVGLRRAVSVPPAQAFGGP